MIPLTLAVLFTLVGFLLGTLAEARAHRRQLKALTARQDELEQLLAVYEITWPIPNGHTPQEEKHA